MKIIMERIFSGTILKYLHFNLNKVLIIFFMLIFSQTALAVVITNNSTTSNISGAAGSTQFYSINIPAGATNLSFVMTGASGDADLYVKFAAVPTTTVYDFRPYLGSSNETVLIGNTVKWYLSYHDSRLYCVFGRRIKSIFFYIYRRYKSDSNTVFT